MPLGAEPRRAWVLVGIPNGILISIHGRGAAPHAVISAYRALRTRAHVTSGDASTLLCCALTSPYLHRSTPSEAASCCEFVDASRHDQYRPVCVCRRRWVSPTIMVVPACCPVGILFRAPVDGARWRHARTCLTWLQLHSQHEARAGRAAITSTHRGAVSTSTLSLSLSLSLSHTHTHTHMNTDCYGAHPHTHTHSCAYTHGPPGRPSYACTFT